MQALSNCIINFFDNLSTTNAFILIPWLRNCPGPKKREFLKVKNSYNLICKFIENEVDEHIKTYQEGHDRDLMDAFITEMHKSGNSKEKQDTFRSK